MKLLLLIATFLSLFSCRNAIEKAASSSIEKAIEKQTGASVEIPSSNEMAKNNSRVEYGTESQAYFSPEEPLQSTVIFNKDKDDLQIAFQLVGETGRSLMATVSHIPQNFSLPLTAKFAVSNRYDGVTPVATVMALLVTENNMNTSAMPYEGTLTITKLSKDEMAFEIQAKGGDITDADSPSNWKPISGKAKITSPILMSYGIDKNDVLK